VIAISADAQDVVGRTRERIGAEFLLLGDPDTEAIRAYNAQDPLNPRIARPQFYIIDETGVIRWKWLDTRTAGRVDPVVVLAALREL